MPEDDVEALARKYALQNAVQHDGSANPKAILGKILGERADLRSKAKELTGVIEQVVKSVNALDDATQRQELESLDPSLLEKKKKEQRQGLKHLPGWDEVDRIVMRFAPNPNGPATLGHSRGMVVHAEYQRLYKELGKPITMMLRYDDTDPAVKPPIPEAYDTIREDFEWLGGNPDKEFKASERLDVYYGHARRLIERGGAYVCECAQGDFKQRKDAGKPCVHRRRSKDEHLEAWDSMLDGGFEPGGAVLRVATEMDHPDPALRDWVAFRIVDKPHPIVGDAYRVWPMLDFESAIEDHEQGMTHVVRGKDLIDSERKQKFVYDYFGWEYPRTMHWGRVQIHGGGKVSKSLLLKGVSEGKYTGWDDVRAPTLAAYRRRGFQPEAIRAFWVAMGLSEKDVEASMENLEAENRKVVEPKADRLFFVPDPVRVEIGNLPDEGVTGHAPLHPDHPERGRRSSPVGGDAESAVFLPAEDASALDEGATFRLKDWGNLTWRGAGRAEWAGDDVSVTKQGVPILQWCAAADGANRTARLLLPDEAATVVEGVVEAAVDGHEGRVVQFERVGFVRVEAVNDPVVAVFAHE